MLHTCCKYGHRDVLLYLIQEKGFSLQTPNKVSNNNNIIIEWLTLPNRHGGMGLIIPIQYSGGQYKASLAITQPLVDCLLKW